MLESESVIHNERTSSHHHDRYSAVKKYLIGILSLIAATACFCIVFDVRTIQFSGTISQSTTTDVSIGIIELEPTSETTEPTQQPTVVPVSEKEESLPPSLDMSQGHCGGPPCYRNRSSVDLEFGSTVQFIFTMGLEGTGHHWMGTLAQYSPALERLKQYEVWPSLAKPFQTLLFDHYKNKNPRHVTGLFNAHCVEDHDESDAFALRQSVISQMQKIEAQANHALKQQPPQGTETLTPIPFPINTYQLVSGRFGEVSYPNFRGDCRDLNYPDLNLLYDACRQAKVDCLQVYLYRHPVEILNSVVSRNFSTYDASSAQLYITDLQVLASQMRNYANKTLGCFGFFESDDEEERTWKEAQLDLWNWGKNATRYYNFLQKNYKSPSNSKTSLNSAGLDKWFNDSDAGPYLKSWWKLHNHVVATCRQAVMGGVAL